MATTARRAGARREIWRDVIEAAAWLVASATLAIWITQGGLAFYSAADVVNAVGRLAGLMAASLVMLQLLLISRSPWIEKAFGHDRTTKLHTRMGKVAFGAMLTHVPLVTFAYSQDDGRNIINEYVANFTLTWFLTLANLGFLIFVVVVIVSLRRIRPRWRYQNWHLTHLLMYVAIGFVIPHQFLQGQTFVVKGFAWWYWLVLYCVAVGSLLVFRIVVPLVQFASRGLVVSEVKALPGGSTSLVITGRGAGSLRARAGQFFLWRFLAKGHWREAHPYSLSAGTRAGTIRITVKPSGDGSAALASIKPGTRVLAEGPLGVFHEGSRVGDRAVLVSAGIGITPVRSLLEDLPADVPVTVIVRASSRDDAPLLDEVEELAARRGATLHTVFGPRASGWTTAAQPDGLRALVPDIAGSDVYICGPVPWAREVEADARAAGVPKGAVHREEFAW